MLCWSRRGLPLLRSAAYDWPVNTGHQSTEALADLRAGVAATAASLGTPSAEPAFSRPPKVEMGDFSSNAAMLLAGSLGSNPRQIADQLVEAIEGGELGASVQRVEVAGPGFVNLFLADGWYRSALRTLLAGDGTGADATGLYGVGPASDPQPRRILVEFVSANPTGPLTAASGRHAAYGDSVCRLLESLGHEVAREYYVNDGGGQIDRFAASIAAAMTGGEAPEDGYEGAYIAGLAKELAERPEADGGPVDATDLDAVGRAGVAAMLAGIRTTAKAYGVEFDRWSSERELHDRGAVQDALDQLAAAGRTYQADGALWLRTTELGDDKDRVLIRAGGEPTYFAADVAYHAEKLRRGYELLIDVLGEAGWHARSAVGMAALPIGASVEVEAIVRIKPAS